MGEISLPTREAVKTGLAMVLAGGVALGLGWRNPYWACIAVAVVSLPTIGESVNKALLRLWGTVVGAVLALGCMALFPQERWPFLVCMSLVLGFCALRSTVSRHPYFWFITGYVAVLIAANVQSGSQLAFYTAVARVQETALGIVVYGLVSIVLWPQQCSEDLHRLVNSLLGVQARVMDQYFARMLGRERPGGAENWYGLEAQLLGQLGRRFEAAESEQFELREARGWWRRLMAEMQALMEAMEVWRESITDLHGLDMQALLPGLPDYGAKLVRRIEELRLAAGEELPGRALATLRLEVDPERLAGLSHVQQAAVHSMLGALSGIEGLRLALGQTLTAIRDPKGMRDAAPSVAPRLRRRLDADGYAAFVRISVGLLLASLTWIYCDPPGHIMFIVFVGVHSLLGQMAPQMNWTKFILANGAGVVLAGVLYVFVMPQLSSYTGLAVLLFVLTVVVYRIYWDPRQTMLKFSAIMPFIMLTGIQTTQHYDFAAFVNSAVGMVLSMVFAAATACIPYAERPETMFLRVLRRYFRQGAAVVACLGDRTTPACVDGAVGASLAAMQVSVGKIGGWAKGADYSLLPNKQPQKAAELVASLTAITYRFKLLADAAARAGDVREEAFRRDAKAWNAAIGEVLSGWSKGNFASASDAPARLAQLEQRVETTFASVAGKPDDAAHIRAYHLLGGYRGLYKSLVQHARLSADIDWDAWRMPRF